MNDETTVGGDELSARVGELRRLTFMYCDLVGSTELSGSLEPETYRELLQAYRHTCRAIIETRFDGHVLRVTGDGALSIFGFPAAHENDSERAVRAGLALADAVRKLPEAASTAGEPLELRIGIHHGPVYLDFDEDDIYGLAANVGSRLEALAEPGTVVVSDEVRQLVEDHFELRAHGPQHVKGVTDPVLTYRVVGERTAPIGVAVTPLVEREEELERLSRAWASVAAGDRERPVGMLICGEAGVGKSRLLAALHDEVRGSGAFLRLQGSPFHVDAGFHPLRRLVETRCDIHQGAAPAERLECVRKEVTRVGLDPSAMVPFLAPVLEVDPSAGYEAATTEGRKLEEQVAQAAFDYVVACARGEPATLVADDLHWFDDATRELLAELLRGGPGNLFIVGASRTREAGPWEAIDLASLSRDGSLALIDALEGGLPEEERLALAMRSDGVPLYLEELVRARGSSPTSDSDAPLPGSAPEALYELLVARLYATPDALPVAAAAAAAGQEVELSLLARAMSIPAQELALAMGELADAQVMQQVAGDGGRYEFRHELLREVAYELQPPSWRRRIHGRLADLLSDGEVSDWRVLASHFELAERHREAAQAYERTAEGARRRGALAEARAHLTRAAGLVDHVAAEEGRDSLEVGIRLQRGFLTMLAEGVAHTDASADFERCLEIAASDPRGEDMASVLAALWASAVSRGDLARARRISETLYTNLDGRTEYLRAEVLHGFGLLDWFEGSFDSALETIIGCAPDLASIEREHQSETFWFTTGYPTLHMRAHLAIARFMAGDAAAADRPLDEAIAAGDSMDFPRGPWSANYARWLGSWVWIEEERFDRAGAALADLHASSARHGFDNWELVAATQDAALDGLRTLGSTPSDVGALAEHAEVLGTFIELWQMLGLKVLLPFSITTQGALLAATGDGESARLRYGESLSLAAETGMRFYDAETMRRIAHLKPDPNEVVSELRAALQLARSQGAQPFEVRIAHDLRKLQSGSPIS